MEMLEKLWALEEIKATKARYCRAVDTKDLSSLRAIFASDIVWDERGAATDPRSGVNFCPEATESVISGIEEVLGAISSTFDLIEASVHQVFMPQIQLHTSTTASAVWAQCDRVRFASGEASELVGYGHYHETYECDDRQWKIKSLRITRLVLDITPRSDLMRRSA